MLPRRKSGATSSVYHQYLPLTRPIEEHEIPDVSTVDTSDYGDSNPHVDEKKIVETFAKEVKENAKIIRIQDQIHRYVEDFNRLRAKQDKLDVEVRELTAALSKAKAKSTENKLRLRRVRSDIIALCKSALSWKKSLFRYTVKRILKKD